MYLKELDRKASLEESHSGVGEVEHGDLPPEGAIEQSLVVVGETATEERLHVYRRPHHFGGTELAVLEMAVQGRQAETLGHKEGLALAMQI